MASHAAYDRLRYAAMRTAVLTLFGNKCGECGFDRDVRALQIDHIEGGGRQERKQRRQDGVMLRVLRGAPGYGSCTSCETMSAATISGSGYQLLCANCNAIKEAIRKEAEHA